MESDNKLQLYRSLFRGRDDVFAKRSPTTGSYFPDYTLNWDEFNVHKANGGRMATFKNKTLTTLTNKIILKHLAGQITVGIYPIIEDNESYFLAADFDKENWLTDCKNYQIEMTKVGLDSYIERSRSGNGGHVWVFFKESYPCHKSRAIGLEAVRKVLQLSSFDKEASFDRLFPNQDSVGRDGFGNLIALPFQGEATRHGNTVFLDPTSSEPHKDQYSVLKNIRRHTTSELEAAYGMSCDGDSAGTPVKSKKLQVRVGQNITLQKRQLNGATIGFLKEHLNFLNTEYLTKKRLGMSLYQTQKYFRLIDENDKTVSLPRGFLSRLLKFLYEEGIKYEVIFSTLKLGNCKFKSEIKLTDIQDKMVKSAIHEKQGVIVAPPGSGKTMMGMELMARVGKPTLILVHRQQILDQWVDRIQTHLNIPKPHIGRYAAGKKTIGKEVTVGLLQSFSRLKDLHELQDKFGTIIIDECHHIPAKTFRQVISGLNPEFLYGLTATPKRKHNDEELIYVYIGDIIANMADHTEPTDLKLKRKFSITIHETTLDMPFNWKTDHPDLIAKTICYDTSRNMLVSKDILEQVEKGRRTLVLSERKEHLKVLELYLKGKCETLTLTGDDSAISRTSKQKQVQDGHYQVLLATGQLVGEGIHIENIESLILAFPFSFEGKLTQYIGRLLHSVRPKELIDYHDQKIPFLDRQFKSRKKVYNRI